MPDTLYGALLGAALGLVTTLVVCLHLWRSEKREWATKKREWAKSRREFQKTIQFLHAERSQLVAQVRILTGIVESETGIKPCFECGRGLCGDDLLGGWRGGARCTACLREGRPEVPTRVATEPEKTRTWYERL